MQLAADVCGRIAAAAGRENSDRIGLAFTLRHAYTEDGERSRACAVFTTPYMLRLTKKADYGLMALKFLAEQAEAAGGRGSAASASAKAIADAYHIPPQLLAKILQTLTRAGILVSTAGTLGGYSLARPASEISAFEVIRAIDGPLFITSCITIHGTCDLHGHCTIKEPLRKVNDAITDMLSGIRIADLVESDAMQPHTPVAAGLVTIAR
jgi:Rrf2 family protein